MTMHVGIAGTGKMGTAIGLNLLDRGYRVSAWNIDRGMMDALVAAGATPFESLETLVPSVDAVIAMLWDDDVAREISLGRLIPAARMGQLVIETTTLSPQMYESLAQAARQRGVDFLACPVFGSVDGARAGTLTLLPGGSDRAFDNGRGLLSAMGSTITFTGSPGASGHLKLAFNSMLAVLADSIGRTARHHRKGRRRSGSYHRRADASARARRHKAPAADRVRHAAALFGERATQRSSTGSRRERKLGRERAPDGSRICRIRGGR